MHNSPPTSGPTEAVQFSVASLNVQEHCRDGLNTYVSTLPHVRRLPKGSGAVARLVDAMGSP
ncbi:MAG: hypothetical protein VXW25_09830, partial [Pseudomonadota bacterium]|nr:hypothetical protein [Pseudomonadota bacterium]